MSTVDTVATEQVMQAARAALPSLPVPAGADLAPATSDDVPADWPVVVQRFTGTPSGWAALALEPATVQALTSALSAASGGGGADPADPAAAADPAQLAAACVAPLQAVTGALGPTAGLDPEVTTLAGLPTQPPPPGWAVVQVGTDAGPAAFVLLGLDGTGGADGGAGAVPTPRASREDAPAGTSGLELLRSVPMEVTAEIGRTSMTIQELLSLAPGSVVELDRPVGSPADLLVNGRLFARGEVVVVDEDFAIRVTEIVDTSENPGS